MVHHILEHIPFDHVRQCSSAEALEPLIQPYIAATPFSTWLKPIAETIFTTLKTPLSLGDSQTPLCQIDSSAQFKEFEFLSPLGTSGGFLKGFIDLAFAHDGRYYLVDWKTNWLGPNEQAYDHKNLEAAMRRHQYDLQSRIYTEAFARFLGSCSIEPIVTVFYLFVRGMNPNEARLGVYHNQQAEALAWQE